WMHFAPRAGLAWDPKGNGMTVVRAAYGIFYDYPHFQGVGGIRNTPPRGGLIQLTNPPGGFDDPWQSYPGGNPLPFAISKDVAFPLGGTYTVIPQDAKTSYVNQWNFSVQKQIGMDWLVAGNYIGLRLSVKRRRARGITIQGNYTYSHCIDTGYTDIIQTNGVMVPERRGANRGNCELDRRHNFNMSTVYETPQFANPFMKVLVTGWRVSGIVRALSGPMLILAAGIDQALTGTQFGGTGNTVQSDQRPDQVLPS